MKKKIFITVLLIVLACFLIVKAYPNEYEATVNIINNTASLGTVATLASSVL